MCLVPLLGWLHAPSSEPGLLSSTCCRMQRGLRVRVRFMISGHAIEEAWRSGRALLG